jgi:hypothetical protein
MCTSHRSSNESIFPRCLCSSIVWRVLSLCHWMIRCLLFLYTCLFLFLLFANLRTTRLHHRIYYNLSNISLEHMLTLSFAWSSKSKKLKPMIMGTWSLQLGEWTRPKPFPKSMLPKNQSDHASIENSLFWTPRGSVFSNFLLVSLMHQPDYEGKEYMLCFLLEKRFLFQKLIENLEWSYF